ncbi:hypothetical protein ACIOUE_35930 [Streptomyces xanthochromogenes]|uniref:hypothetical protein n=1 Tax=Streptomyces xanthochromogenes TaxID=67384 RepID=UPI00380E8E41
MPANVWILNPSYRDGPYQLLRMGWIAYIEQDIDGHVVAHDSRGEKFFLVRMSKKAEVPTDFGVQLLRTLDRARREAAELDSDRVVAARHSDENGWSWQVYAPDEVPPAQIEPPAPPSTSTLPAPPPPWARSIRQPEETPLWAPQEQPESITE